MTEQPKKAIQYAYINTDSYNDMDYRVVPETEIAKLVEEITSSCDVNASSLTNTNYCTSYEITITDHDVPTPAQELRDPNKRQRLTLPSYILTVRISWLGRLAMMFWNLFRKWGDPELLWFADTERNMRIEACVLEIVESNGIKLLSREELSQEIPIPGLVLLDNAPHTVAHLLFAQYL